MSSEYQIPPFPSFPSPPLPFPLLPSSSLPFPPLLSPPLPSHAPHVLSSLSSVPSSLLQNMWVKPRFWRRPLGLPHLALCAVFLVEPGWTKCPVYSPWASGVRMFRPQDLWCLGYSAACLSPLTMLTRLEEPWHRGGVECAAGHRVPSPHWPKLPHSAGVPEGLGW